MVLAYIISHSQGAFVDGRSIVNNVMICQNLVKMYSRKNTRASYLMKLNLRKACDMLEGVGFSSHFVKLIMVCVKTPKLIFIMLNIFY